MDNINSNLESSFELLNENYNNKLQELHKLQEEFAKNINELQFQSLALNSKITKIEQDILKYKEVIRQRQHILCDKDKLSENIDMFKNIDFDLDAQQTMKNMSMYNMVLLQKEKEEKKTSNLTQEIVELDVEEKTLKWDYIEINKKYNDLQNLIDNYKIMNNYEFESIKEIEPYLK